MSQGPTAAVPPGRLSKGWRRAVLAVHVLCGVGWLGLDLALVVLLVVARAAGTDADESAAERAVALVVPWLVPVLAAGMLLSGLLLGWGTQWGLLSHTWVVVKLVIGVAITALVYLRLVPQVFGVVVDPKGGEEHLAGPATAVRDALDRAAEVPLLPPLVSFTVLGVALVLSFWKPGGRTPWAERRASRREPRQERGGGARAEVPRQVRRQLRREVRQETKGKS